MSSPHQVKSYNAEEVTLHWLEEYIAQGILTTDSRFCIRHWNSWLELHSGLKAADVCGQSLFKVFPGLVTRKLDNYYKQALAGQVFLLSQRLHGYLLPLQAPGAGPDDPFLKQSARIAPLIAGEETIGTITIIKDVTERVLHEAELRHQIASLEALNDIGSAILSLDLEECLQRVVERAAQLLRAPVAAVALVYGGKIQVDAAIGLHNLEQLKNMDKGLAGHLVATGPPVLFNDLRAQPAPPTIKPLAPDTRSLMSAPLLADGAAIGALVIESPLPDVFTAGMQRQVLRLATQAAVAIKNARLFDGLRESEKELSDFFENAIFGLQWVNAEGQIERVNRAQLQLLGYPAVDYIGRQFSEFFIKPTLETELRARLQAGETLREAPAELRAKDGSVRHVLLDANALAPGGKVAHSRWVIKDITEQKKATEALLHKEEQLRHAQKMEAVGRLAGSVAHDFNNLLTAIIGYSQILLRKVKPDDALHQYAYEIAKAGERSAMLTSQLLTFSRKQIAETKIIDLNSLVADTNKLLRRLIGEQIQLVAELDDTILKIKADPGQISQVVMNLAVNARDAMPKGGALRIQTSCVDTIDCEKEALLDSTSERYVLLKISDTGCGMDPETLARIFEPYFTTKEEGRGTGLGLSTVYGIVKQCGGAILVESQTGQGTTFKIYLPGVTGSSIDDIVWEKHDLTAQESGTILLVEDDEFVRRLAFRVLEDRGYYVLEAVNGEEALQLARHFGPRRIDLLLADLVMPQMGGKELAHRLLQLNPQLKVLYVSGYADPSIVGDADWYAANPFLQKPFSPLTLTKEVRALLS